MRRFACLMLSVWMLSLAAAGTVSARGTYQTPEDFLAEVFDGDVPEPRVLWLKGGLRQTATDILGHRYPSLRIRYWLRDGRSAWILEEIGKEQPITTGIVVDQGRIERIKVLIFRESRGWEVRYPFFTDQFRGATLNERLELDRDIDGISGATLSVRALERLARLALFLDSEARKRADVTP